MRLFNAIMVAFIGLAIATPIAMEDELVERTHQNKGFSLDKRPTIPSVSGLKFNIDGTTAYFAGTNTY
jgi:mannan endo-1,4-beta-mannosidase